MRVGLVVDGQSEVDALRSLIQRINPPHELVGIVNARFHPEATPKLIAETIEESYGALRRRRVDRIVVLLDLEQQADCPGMRAAAIRREMIERLASPQVTIDVVVKVTMLENWLIADPACFREMPALFPEAGRIARAVRGDRADNLDALALLNSACGPRRRYDKRRGAVAICQRMDPGRAALNSRSFRRFLRELED